MNETILTDEIYDQLIDMCDKYVTDNGISGIDLDEDEDPSQLIIAGDTSGNIYTQDEVRGYLVDECLSGWSYDVWPWPVINRGAIVAAITTIVNQYIIDYCGILSDN